MAGTQEVVFDVNTVGWAPSGSGTAALSLHNEDPARLPAATVLGHGRKTSGRYVLEAGRAAEEDSLCQAITPGVLKPRVTYRVAGWIGVAAAEASHAVHVSILVDDGRLVVDAGAVCAEPGKWAEIKGAFRLRETPCSAAVHVHGAPAGVGHKVMDLRIFATDRKARFIHLKEKTDKKVMQTTKGQRLVGHDRDQLMSVMEQHLRGLLSRYAGRFPHYDVNNEMLHGRFYRDRLGDDAAALMFREAARLDPGAALFVNGYNDPNATPEKYIELIRDLQRGGAQVGGIGLQGHVTNPVGEVICDALDKLATTDLPVWITELDVCEPDEGLRADDLEMVLREAYAPTTVVMNVQHCRKRVLTC